LGALGQNGSFTETGFTGQADFIVDVYLATNNDLPSNNIFRFQGNVGNSSFI
jgi:hypothetical protein